MYFEFSFLSKHKRPVLSNFVIILYQVRDDERHLKGKFLTSGDPSYLIQVTRSNTTYYHLYSIAIIKNNKKNVSFSG